jgi:hypothetical protein
MNFAEKNSFVVKYTDDKEFFQDLELFKKHFPNDRLNHDLARANSITYRRLDGSMLLRMLEKIPPDEILENRKSLKKGEEAEAEQVEAKAEAEQVEAAKKKEQNG